jgi:DNA repair protein RadC
MDSAKNHEGHRERLRKRFQKVGFTGFAEHEIVELFLTLCLPRKDVKPLAKALLQKFGSIREIFDADIQALSQVKGMGHVAPIAIKIVKNFSELYLKENIPTHANIIDNYDRLERFWRLRLGGLKNEVFEIALLNAQLGLLKDGVVRLEEGVADRTNAYPRKIMEYVLRNYASAFIIAHNHPSGGAAPSDNDCLLTKRIEKSAESLEIAFVDHVIVARDKIFSFRRERLIGSHSHGRK